MVKKRGPSHPVLDGRRGERRAAWYLRFKGYRIVEKNFLCRSGEIDIVAMKGNVLVFVEVRSRREGSLVSPLESIDSAKIARMVRAARRYLALHCAGDARCRFDVVAVRIRGDLWGRIRHYKDVLHTSCDAGSSGGRLQVLRRRDPGF